MKTCPRCESSIDESARFCEQCGAPQTEAAAEELDELVQRQAKQVAAESGGGGGGNSGGGGGAFGQGGGGGGGGGSGDGGAGADDLVGAAREELSDREALWRRGSYVVGYATIVVALTRITSPGAWFLLLGGVAILPPTRRLLGRPVGGTFKREAMAGLYAVFVVLGALLLVLL